jgi:hypothetical protein
VLYQLSYIPTVIGDLEDCTRRYGHLSKQMNRLLHTAMFALALGVALDAAVPGHAAAAIELAANRCNSQTIDDAAARVRDYDHRGPGGSQAQLLQRYGAIADVIATLGEEREILNTVCSSDVQRAALFTQIAATMAWALTLEGDAAARLNVSCPAAAQAFPTMMLADAWLALANVINDGDGAVPGVFDDVIPKIRTRAQAVGLTLPAWPETSQYWRDRVHVKARAAIASCPSPSPSPSP